MSARWGQVNMFEQVPSWPLAGSPCMALSKASWVMVTWDSPCRQTHTTENIIFPQLRWRVVIKSMLKRQHNIHLSRRDTISSTKGAFILQ